MKEDFGGEKLSSKAAKELMDKAAATDHELEQLGLQATVIQINSQGQTRTVLKHVCQQVWSDIEEGRERLSDLCPRRPRAEEDHLGGYELLIFFVNRCPETSHISINLFMFPLELIFAVGEVGMGTVRAGCQPCLLIIRTQYAKCISGCH